MSRKSSIFISREDEKERLSVSPTLYNDLSTVTLK